MTEDAQKAAQEKAMMYQIMQAQMEELARQATVLESRMIELETADNALKEVDDAKEGSDILLPLGAGCYGYGKLTRKDSFMVEIGSELVKSMPLKDTLAVIDDKKNEVEHAARKLKMEMDRIRGTMDRIGLELQELAGKEQKDGAVHVG